MPGIRKILRTVQRIDDPTVDRAMAAALPSADPDAARVLALMLLQREHPDGTLGLVLHFQHLPPDVQQTVTDNAGSLFRPLRRGMGLAGSDGPTNALRIIRASHTTRLAYLVGEQLRQGTPELREQAADCLLAMARHAASNPRPGHPPPADATAAAYLQSAIEDAVRLYANHQHEAVLLAAVTLLPRPLTKVAAAFAEPRHPAVEPMRGIATQATDPAVRRALPALAAIAPLTGAAIDGLRLSAQAGRLGESLAGAHLMTIAATRHALSTVRSAATLWPGEDQVRRMQPHELRGLPAWATVLPFERPTRIDMLRRLAEAPDAATRLFALRRLIRLAEEERGDGLFDAIASFTTDPTAGIARIAMWSLHRSGWENLAGLLATLVNSPHEEIRRLAARQLAPLGFARLWEHWPGLDPGQRLAAGRALIKLEPGFHRMLGDKLLRPDQPSRLRALSMITALNQGSFFEAALIRLAEGPDRKVTSAAVKALGSATDAGAEATLAAALDHEDNRVRANAVEAVTQLESDRHTEALRRMSRREENRPRANAIGALMDRNASEAMEALTRMLGDERPRHRTSALWLVESLGLIELTRRVAEMSITDPDSSVKQRAERLIRRLITELAEDPPDGADRIENPTEAA